jgi:g-D-glutamyl-meso-diaminopimelate peptidase
MEHKKELSYEDLIEKLNEICEKNDFIRMSYIGNTILSKPIPLIELGDEEAKKSVLYVSTHHASENVCTSVILAFIEDYIRSYEALKQTCGINVRYLYKMRKILIVPMLNPDGVNYRLKGVGNNNPIKERVIAYNEGTDFTHWNANARGVDLNHNYDAGFDEYKKYEKENGITPGKTKYSGEYPESEPEVQALASLIRFYDSKLIGILTLHSQGEEIYYKSRGECPKHVGIIARHISRMTGYRLSDTEGSASFGGLTDWCIEKLQKPSFTIECGKGENPLDIGQAGQIYLRLRELFFTFPILF